MIHGSLVVTLVALGERAGRAAAEADPRRLKITPFQPGAAANLSAYDGRIPGPVLRLVRGQEFRCLVENGLAVPTAVHWHGLRIDNRMDGAPPLTQAAIAPGESFLYRFTPPDAGTFWYRPPRPRLAGLFGAVIVEDAAAPRFGDDFVLVLSDHVLTAGGDKNGSNPTEGLSVNGEDSLDISAHATGPIRLRLVNAAFDRAIALRLQGLHGVVAAIDGQPAEPFVPQGGRVLLGPGNRLDLIATGPIESPGSAALLVQTADGERPIAQLRRTEEKSPPGGASGDPPGAVPANPLPERMDFGRAVRRDIALGSLPAGPSPRSPLLRAKRGQTVMLGLSNSTADERFIHLHGHSFRLLDARDDGWKPFWLDSLPVPAQGRAQIAFVADNPGKWLVEGCATAADQDPWFEVE